jgi:hypothetical protein
VVRALGAKKITAPPGGRRGRDKEELLISDYGLLIAIINQQSKISNSKDSPLC